MKEEVDACRCVSTEVFCVNERERDSERSFVFGEGIHCNLHLLCCIFSPLQVAVEQREMDHSLVAVRRTVHMLASHGHHLPKAMGEFHDDLPRW